MSLGPGAGSVEPGFFELGPGADATTFQVGYLGLQGFLSWVVGDVMVKLDAPDAPQIFRWYDYADQFCVIARH